MFLFSYGDKYIYRDIQPDLDFCKLELRKWPTDAAVLLVCMQKYLLVILSYFPVHFINFTSEWDQRKVTSQMDMESTIWGQIEGQLIVDLFFCCISNET